MAEGTETPRPRRAFAADPPASDSPPAVGRRGYGWPSVDQDAEEQVPVSRRAWTEPPADESAKIQQASQPARQVTITPVQTSASADAGTDTGVPDDATVLRPPPGAPAGGPPDDATVLRGPAPRTPRRAGNVWPNDSADDTPDDATVLRAPGRRSMPSPDEPDDRTVLRRPGRTPRPAGAGPAGGVAGPASAGTAAGAGAAAAATPSSPSGQAGAASGPAVPAASAAGFGTPPTDDVRGQTPMPTLQPPTYSNQPLPAPQTPAPDPAEAIPTGRDDAASTATATEWDAPTETSLDRRTRFSLSLAAVAAVLIVALAIGYAVIAGRGSEVATEPGNSESPTVTRPPDPYPSERMLLTDAAAKLIDDGAAWKTSLTQQGLSDDSPRPTCIRHAIDGEPVPRGTMLRTLTTSGDGGATALHLLDTYATADEAAQVFASRATQIGGCDRDPTLITAGYAVTDIGDESVAVTTEVQDDKGIRHTILLTRTGTAVNIIDIAQPEAAADINGVASAMATVVDAQCNAAVGLCSLTPQVKNAPPPPAGGDPGFLAAADIPRITSGAGSWSANPASSDVTVVGSQCEGVSSWGAVEGAEDSRMATYLLMDDPASPNAFGMDEVLLTMASDKAAQDFVKKVNDSMADCSDRMLTATVSDPVEVKGNGTGGAAVQGYVYDVTQKSGDGELGYRVGIISSNAKVAYLVLPVDGKFDFTVDQWKSVTQRAGERASQVR